MGLLRALKRVGGMGEELVTPLVILGLAELVLAANLGHRFALEPLEHDHGFGLGIPLPHLHG